VERKRIFQILVFTILTLFFADPSLGQKLDKGKKSVSSLSVRDTLDQYSDSDLFLFPNVNKILYFRDEGKRKQIDALEKKKDWEALYPVLRQYVAKFGIANFYRDTRLIWRLAKLEEVYGDPREARLLYRLILKHHRTDIDIRKVELYYDSLTANEIDYYVPLQYYYELVDYRREVDTLRPPRSVLINMGPLVNSRFSDYGPALSVKDDIMLFTSKRNSHHRGVDKVNDEDIFFSKRDGEVWLEAAEFNGINTSYNEGSPCLSKDGRTMYFARCDSPDGLGDCDIFMSTLQADSTWTRGKNLGPLVNSVAWDSHPSLSHSEDTLYFASDRMGGFGLSDIYFTVRNKEGNWTKAQNAGPIINTRNNEVSPFYHHIYDVLYFSSNGHALNFGEFDIYKSYRKNQMWQEPKNIGPLVNGAGTEFYFTIDSRSEFLYYARSAARGMDNLDLYSFPLPMEAQPGATTVVRGTLLNEQSGEPFKGIVSIIDMDNGIEVAPKFLRPDGSFEFDLINNNNYLLIVQGDEFFRIEELFYLDGDLQLHLTTKPISSKLKFESVEFEGGKAELTLAMYKDLDKLVDFMLDNPEFNLTISGHTDADGREEFNLRLSQDRADAIKEYLVYFGKIQAHRIEAKGFGSSRPIIRDPKTDAEKRINRRVEFEIRRD
jgi:outer membrane protein OmpA-like peptidoglycan-associated protein